MPKRYDQEVFENGLLQIFRRKPSGNFYSRIRHTHPQRSGQTLSLHTNDRDKALGLAFDRFRQSDGKRRDDRPTVTKRLPEAIKAFSKYHRNEVDQGRVGLKWHQLKLTNLDEWKAYLKRKPIDQITRSDIDGFENWRLAWIKENGSRLANKRVDISSRTLSGKHADLIQLLNWCAGQGWIKRDQIPEFKLDRTRARRPAFTQSEFDQITASIGTWILADKHRVVVKVRQQMGCYVPIMGLTGMRAGEARELKWKHIGDVAKYGDVDGLKIDVPRETKTGTRELIASADVQDHFEQLKHVYSDTWGFEPTSQDYVFCSIDRRKRNNFLKAFNGLLKFAGVTHNNVGEKYTIYSLRHFYATQQLKRGVPIYDLAKNMGTSVAMIEKHYSHVKSDDVAERLIGK